MKPTAVEFAVEQLEQLIPSGHQLAIRAILEQSKEIEKQQIIEGYQNGSIDTLKDELKFGKQYYNEQFKNK
jgi:hypothetical protein